MVVINWLDSMLESCVAEDDLKSYALQFGLDYDAELTEGYNSSLFEISSQHQKIFSVWSELPIRRLSETFRKALKDGAASTTLEFSLEEIDIYLFRRAKTEFDARIIIRDFVTVGATVSFQGVIIREEEMKRVLTELHPLVEAQRRSENHS